MAQMDYSQRRTRREKWAKRTEYRRFNVCYECRCVRTSFAFSFRSKMRRYTNVLVLGFALLGMLVPSRALAWEWLRSSNKNVEEGNAKIKNNDQKGALESYDKAARELPSNGGVHLDRGLALMKGQDINAARQALLLATEPSSSSDIRANAYYDLGLSFYREADAKAAEENHSEAQKLLREAADSYKRSLRLRPQNRDAAWNLELAVRRIREEEKKQKEKEEKEKKEQEQKKQDDNKQDQQQKDQNQQQQDQDKKDEQQKQDQKQKEQNQDTKQDQQQQQQQKEQEKQKQEKPVPQDVERALDALQNGEENLERYRARMRANQERRQPEKDW
jgi:Ca-activated chloride channel homolog